jgi:chromosome segregation ATPase
MGKIRDWLWGKPSPPPLDVIAMHETRTAGMRVLAPQVETWRNWLVVHTQEIEQEQDGVVSDIKRLDGTKQGFEGLKESITKHRKSILDASKTIKNLLDSFTPEPDPAAEEDVIGLHTKALTELQIAQKESLTNVSKALGNEADSMESREESVETELEGVTEKLERLNEAKKTLNSEKEITETFKENIATFIVSKFAPPKSQKN